MMQRFSVHRHPFTLVYFVWDGVFSCPYAPLARDRITPEADTVAGFDTMAKAIQLAAQLNQGASA